MKPVFFNEANCTLTGSGDVRDMPVYRDEIGIISKWQMTNTERLIAAQTGVVWVRVAGATHPPIAVFGRRPFDDEEAEKETLEAAAYVHARGARREDAAEASSCCTPCNNCPDAREIIDRVLPTQSPWWMTGAILLTLALCCSIITGAKVMSLALLTALIATSGRASVVAIRFVRLAELDEEEEPADGD